MLSPSYMEWTVINVITPHHFITKGDCFLCSIRPTNLKSSSLRPLVAVRTFDRHCNKPISDPENRIPSFLLALTTNKSHWEGKCRVTTKTGYVTTMKLCNRYHQKFVAHDLNRANLLAGCYVVKL